MGSRVERLTFGESRHDAEFRFIFKTFDTYHHCVFLRMFMCLWVLVMKRWTRLRVSCSAHMSRLSYVRFRFRHHDSMTRLRMCFCLQLVVAVTHL